MISSFIECLFEYIKITAICKQSLKDDEMGEEYNRNQNAEQTRNQHHSIVTIHVQSFPLYIGLINHTLILIILND